MVDTNGCLDLRCRALSPGERVRAGWNRCPGSMQTRNQVAQKVPEGCRGGAKRVKRHAKIFAAPGKMRWA